MKTKSLKISGKEVRFKVHPDSDEDGPFQSILVLDDSEETMEYFCMEIAEMHKKVLVCGCLKHSTAFYILKDCYFDVFVCDMKLDGTTGDILIKTAKTFYPLIFVIAYTGFLTEMGPLAARAGPDRLVHKTAENMEEFFAAVSEGLSLGKENRAKIDEELKGHKVGEHWRRAYGFKKLVGHSPTQYKISCRKTYALALKKLCSGMSLENIAFTAGFVSGTHLKKEISIFLPFL